MQVLEFGRQLLLLAVFVNIGIFALALVGIVEQAHSAITMAVETHHRRHAIDRILQRHGCLDMSLAEHISKVH